MLAPRSPLPRTLGTAALLVAVAVPLTLTAGASQAARPSAMTMQRHATVRIFVPRGDPGPRCTRVFPLRRTVSRPAVLTGALRALLAGPTVTERHHGYGGWFSTRTVRALHSVHIDHGVAFVDLHDLSHTIPSASSSCGSALLLAQLDRTVMQFPTVKRAVYSFHGDHHAFYEWLQRDAPPPGHHSESGHH